MTEDQHKNNLDKSISSEFIKLLCELLMELGPKPSETSEHGSISLSFRGVSVDVPDYFRLIEESGSARGEYVAQDEYARNRELIEVRIYVYPTKISEAEFFDPEEVEAFHERSISYSSSSRSILCEVIEIEGRKAIHSKLSSHLYERRLISDRLDFYVDDTWCALQISYT